MIPDIWSTTDRIFSHFGALFTLHTPPPDNLVNQNFEKMKKKHLEISSFYANVP